MASPNVLVFATGGTIGMRDTESGLAPDPDFPEVLEQLVADICAPLGLDHRVNHLLPSIDSANADSDTAPRIARAIRARVRTQQPRGVVVTHGTDTLAFTAARLAFELADIGAPVIVTGSQFPHAHEASDATANLSLAIRTSVRAARTAPVCIAFGGELLPAIRATKFDASALRAFRAERPLAPHALGIPPLPLTSLDPPAGQARVLTLRFTPGMTTADVRAAVGGDPDGLVLETYGSGNAPTGRPGMLAALKEISARMPVVAVTQCAVGAVQSARYAVGRELSAAGVISGDDLTVEAAVAKLGYLLDTGYDQGTIGQLMTQNLVGECGAR